MSVREFPDGKIEVILLDSVDICTGFFDQIEYLDIRFGQTIL